MDVQNNRESSEELSAATLSIFPKIARAWKLTNAEKQNLLGGSLDNLQDFEDPDPILADETLARAGFIVGIFECLIQLYPDIAPSDQVREVKVFNAQSALDLMLTGLAGLFATYCILERQVEVLDEND